MNNRSKKWFCVNLEYQVDCFDIKKIVSDTPYGIETLEYFNLRIFGFEYIPVNEYMMDMGEALLIENNPNDEIPKPLSEWIELYQKERRDKLARVAGIAPEDFDAPTATINRPKM